MEAITQETGERKTPANNFSNSERKPHPLDLLFERSCTLVDRVVAGELPFIDAVDMAASAAEFSGLTDIYGQDAIQETLAAAFIRVPLGAKCAA